MVFPCTLLHLLLDLHSLCLQLKSSKAYHHINKLYMTSNHLPLKMVLSQTFFIRYTSLFVNISLVVSKSLIVAKRNFKCPVSDKEFKSTLPEHVCQVFISYRLLLGGAALQHHLRALVHNAGFQTTLEGAASDMVE